MQPTRHSLCLLAWALVLTPVLREEELEQQRLMLRVNHAKALASAPNRYGGKLKDCAVGDFNVDTVTGADVSITEVQTQVGRTVRSVRVGTHPQPTSRDVRVQVGPSVVPAMKGLPDASDAEPVAATLPIGIAVGGSPTPATTAAPGAPAADGAPAAAVAGTVASPSGTSRLAPTNSFGTAPLTPASGATGVATVPPRPSVDFVVDPDTSVVVAGVVHDDADGAFLLGDDTSEAGGGDAEAEAAVFVLREHTSVEVLHKGQRPFFLRERRRQRRQEHAAVDGSPASASARNPYGNSEAEMVINDLDGLEAVPGIVSVRVDGTRPPTEAELAAALAVLGLLSPEAAKQFLDGSGAVAGGKRIRLTPALVRAAVAARLNEAAAKDLRKRRRGKNTVKGVVDVSAFLLALKQGVLQHQGASGGRRGRPRSRSASDMPSDRDGTTEQAGAGAGAGAGATDAAASSPKRAPRARKAPIRRLPSKRAMSKKYLSFRGAASPRLGRAEAERLRHMAPPGWRAAIAHLRGADKRRVWSTRKLTAIILQLFRTKVRDDAALVETWQDGDQVPLMTEYVVQAFTVQFGAGRLVAVRLATCVCAPCMCRAVSTRATHTPSATLACHSRLCAAPPMPPLCCARLMNSVMKHLETNHIASLFARLIGLVVRPRVVACRSRHRCTRLTDCRVAWVDCTAAWSTPARCSGGATRSTERGV